jgi:hypothetical protein
MDPILAEARPAVAGFQQRSVAAPVNGDRPVLLRRIVLAVQRHVPTSG